MSPDRTKHMSKVEKNYQKLKSISTNGIVFIYYSYLMNKHYPVDLIGVKTAFAEALRNAWKLSIKSGLIQNLGALSHYTKAYHVYH